MKKMTLNEWIEALRSGKYKQAKGRLKDGDSYCCLGVLCDIAGAEWDEEENGFIDGIKYQPKSYPVEIIRDVLCVDLGGHIGCTLSNLNDEGKSFKQIANKLEKIQEKNINTEGKIIDELLS